MAILKNTKHEKFAQGVAKGLTQAEAYAQAGYEAKAEALWVNASRLLRAAKVSDRVAELKTQITERVVEKAAVTPAMVIDELGKIGFVELNPADVKVADKRAALVDIGKILGMFKERVEHSGTVTFEHMVLEAAQMRVIEQKK